MVEQSDLPPLLKAFGADLAVAMKRDEAGRAASAVTVGSGRRPRLTGRKSLPRLGRPLIAAIALLVGLSSVGGLALAGTFDGNAISPQSWVDGQRVQPEAAMTPDQTADLEILRRPRVASDELPASLVPSFTDNPQAGSGANPSLSRRAQGFDNGSAWVIPGDGMICFAARTSVTGLGGEGCGSDASVNAGRMMVVGANAASPGLFGVAGIVPDGVNTVTITPTDGSSESVAVHENVYMADVRGAFSVSFDGPSGPVAVGTFAPPAASQSQPLSCGSADGSSC